MVQRIFLSHDNRDGPLAKVIAETVSRISLKQIEVWYSSDPSPSGGIRPGQVWANEVKSRLLASRAILVLLTANSLHRPWLYFESGYIFSQDCQVIPLCLGIRPLDVPFPLAMFQCYELNDPGLLAHFCKKFFDQLEISFDEEMAAPILLSAAEKLKSLMPQPIVDVSRRGACACDVSDRLEGCFTMLRTMYDDLPMPVHSIDETGVICNVNRRWLEVLGYKREEVIGKPADFLMTTESAELAMLLVIPHFWERGFCQDISYQYKKKDGSLIDVILTCFATTDSNGKRISLSFVQVVSNQRTFRRLRKEWKARCDQKLRGKPVGFYEMDLFGNFTTVNDYMCQLLGFTKKEELVGRNFRDVIDSETAKSIFNAYHSVFTNRTPKSSYIWKIRRKDGKTITVESTVSLITLPNGKAIAFRGSVRDRQSNCVKGITKRKL